MTEPVIPDWPDIEAACEGNQAAYARLMQKYQPQVTRLLWRFTHDPHQLEELVQDAFIEAFKSLHRFRGEASFWTWLRKICLRVGYRFWKKQNAWYRRHQSIEESNGVDLLDWKSLEARNAKEIDEILFRLIARLPVQDRVLITSYYLEEMPVRDIASAMHWSENTAKVRLHRARKKLLSLWEQMSHE